ncbi:MAG TPA: hypothetical protein H9735_05075 [Candidatus Anaerostipes excrementavium]|uniref:ATPase n=1 Tax=Candidatus Anaerostipes excrementavium TaxID=2838463 RepID=A0A9D1WV98_9FIRM|nr:hypothetical protein [uncultured Anaerostipes sp.]HIX67486.1 hypothetical protein [Candidatus Anaerostipes excrementavium]
MNGIAEKLAEIENTARAIVENVENQKHLQEKEMQEKRDQFDQELERKTKERIESIRSELQQNMDKLLERQGNENDSEIRFLKQDFEENHTAYAEEIFQKIIEI